MKSKCCNFDTIPPEKDEDNNSNWRAQSCYICKKCGKACEIMENYLDIQFQYYPSDIRITKPLGDVSLYEYLKAIKQPKPHILETFKEIERVSLIGDLKTKAELKAKLPYFTPCIYSNGEGRSYHHIKSWTGLMIVDIDGLDVEFAKEFKEYLFNTYPFFIAVFLSASKKGIKGVVKIPICNSTDEFKAYFYGLMVEFQHYLGIDFTSKNCSLANYLTYDTELLYRLDATTWDKRGIQLDEFQVYEGEIETVVNPSEEDIYEIKRIIKGIFSKITDSGHIFVRNGSLVGGGYISAGYIEYNDMKDFLLDLIDNTEYLQKSLKTYKTTCLDMLRRGMMSPIYLRKDEK